MGSLAHFAVRFAALGTWVDAVNQELSGDNFHEFIGMDFSAGLTATVQQAVNTYFVAAERGYRIYGYYRLQSHGKH